jgi:nitrite reductase/ring-hydroxylating ferredoxin subunit
MLPNKLKAICSSEVLREVAYREESIALRGQPTTAVIFVFDGKPYSYVNHCMHMQRRLNCEQATIFDDTGRYLRCSMHGFIFDPKTGECQSPVCYGQRLQALRVEEIEGTVYFAEKHLTLGG